MAGAVHRGCGRRDGAGAGHQPWLLAAGVPQRLDVDRLLANLRPAADGSVDASLRQRAAPRVCGSDPGWNSGDVMASLNRRTERWSSARGAELIEFALVLPLMLLLLLGTVDFGLLFQRYHVVTNAAREGARVAVLPGYASADVQARVT